MAYVSAKEFLSQKNGSPSTPESTGGYVSAQDFLKQKAAQSKRVPVSEIPLSDVAFGPPAPPMPISTFQNTELGKKVVEHKPDTMAQPVVTGQQPIGLISDGLKTAGQFVKRSSASLAAAVTPATPYFHKDGGFDLSRPTPREEAITRRDAISVGDKADKVADFIGEGASYFAPVGGPGANSLKLYNSPLVQNLAGKASSVFSKPLAQKVAGEATREALVGAPLLVQHSMAQGESDPKKLAMTAAEGAILGAAGGAAVPVIGAGAKALWGKIAGSQLGDAFNAFLGKSKPAQQSEILALPEPKSAQRLRDAQQRSNLPTNETPIYGQGDVHTFELPEPQGIPKVLEDIKSETYQRITPPYENPNELAKWVQSHLGENNISLNEVRKLPYDDLREMAGLMRERLSAKETAALIAKEKGHNLNELVAGRMVSGQFDAPVSVAGFKTAKPYKPRIRQTDFQRTDPIDYPFENVPPKQDVPITKEITPTIEPEDIVQTAEPRVRDRVVSYLDEQIAAAQERLKAKRNTLSSNPVDQYADYALIGASYVGKGIVKLADFTEHMVREFGEQIRPHIRQIFKQAKDTYKAYEKRVQKDMQGLSEIPMQFLNDIRSDQVYTNDIYRNFEHVFGEKFPQIKKAILDPFDAAKGQFAEMQEKWLDKLKSEVVDKLGIDKGSKLSALVQKYGEKEINILELKQQAPDDWKKVVKADEWFRQAYDELIDLVNKTRGEIYPTNPSKLVPKRNDYYRHFKEKSGLTGLYNIFDSPAQIDPNLVGISEWTSPKSKWASFMQKRGVGPYKNDAVGGFLGYLQPAAYATHIDPYIDVFRNLGKNLAEETTDHKNINNFINFLNRFSQDLAGKTNPLDRPFQEVFGRKTMAVLNWINGRVKTNTVLGNTASALAQFGNVPNGIAFAKQHSVEGFGKTILSQMGKVPEMQKSTFLKERYIDKKYRQFDTDWLDIGNPARLKSFAAWTMETVDRVSTEFIWNSAYAKATAEGIENPVKYADDWARKLVAGRGIGEVPLLQKSKVFQMVAPFQLEVANLWKVQGDFVKRKDFGALATLAVSSYVFNKAMEQVRGSGVVFDPIQAVVDAYEASKDEFKPLESFGRLAGEVLSNVPLGQSVAAAYPEYGKEVLGMQLPTRDKLFGKNDPTRFGGGLVAVKGIQDPLYMLAPGFGGNQIKKTIKGAKAIANSGDFTPKGELKFPMEIGPKNAAQTVLFGPSATSEAREYYDNERRPLSQAQTEEYQRSKNPQQFYDRVHLERAMQKIERQMDDVRKDEKLSREEKLAKIRQLQSKLKELRK